MKKQNAMSMHVQLFKDYKNESLRCLEFKLQIVT